MKKIMTTLPANETFLRVNYLTNVPEKDGKPAKPGKLGISRTSLYRLIAEGKFPPPCRPLPGIVAWPESAVNEWMKSHMSA